MTKRPKKAAFDFDAELARLHRDMKRATEKMLKLIASRRAPAPRRRARK